MKQVLLLAAMLLYAGCRTIEQTADALFDDRPPRQRYADALAAAGLAGTALVDRWTAAGRLALEGAPSVTLPHAEDGFLPPNEPVALSFRVAARRGQEVRLDFTLPDDSTSLVFLDAWAVDSATLRPIRSGDSGSRSLVIEPRRDGEVVFRVQLELLRGGRFRAEVRAAPTLAFPVGGGRNSDIGSGWGAPRDGGVRSHHGIDIFARRGTPTLAAADARVTRVEETGIGGRVVWLRDERGHSLYYAHLDSQTVVRGQQVRRGDTVGFVGNTGNARTTPPHLHFGIYRRGEGPINPVWFVRRLVGTAPRLAADTALVGHPVRTKRDRVSVNTGPGDDPAAAIRVPRHTAATAIGATGRWYRVVFPDGVSGYLDADSVEPLDGAIAVTTLGAPSVGLLAPGPAAAGAVVTMLAAGDTLDVFGRFGGYALVGTAAGTRVWIAD